MAAQRFPVRRLLQPFAPTAAFTVPLPSKAPLAASEDQDGASVPQGCASPVSGPESVAVTTCAGYLQDFLAATSGVIPASECASPLSARARQPRRSLLQEGSEDQLVRRYGFAAGSSLFETALRMATVTRGSLPGIACEQSTLVSEQNQRWPGVHDGQ